MAPIALVLAIIVVALGGIYLVQVLREPPPAGDLADRAVPNTIDLTIPFAGTPAQDWADGAAGIVVPEPRAVDGHEAERVGAAYEQVRRILVTARLDRTVIEGGDGQALAALFAQDVRESVAAEFAPGSGTSVLGTRIAPGFRLAAAEPKVSGRMWAESGPDGSLLVRTNYVFAYAFHTDDPDSLVSTLDTVAMIRADVDFAVLEGKSWEPVSRGVRPEASETGFYAMACGPAEAGMLAPAWSEPGYGTAPDPREPRDYFDPAAPMDFPDGCA
ncbi:hypothetical protein CFN78_08415 [Amycolatopsis antarctica]|uniref:Uncharacterized protein n=1 Tax=Amycolatopsis antarctica TaxID=1854586 RepID=A0A263D4Y3_9PSEU|nr:hypothetical protein [Amycolatopsis antarctica]OZM73552.1 hypothetical protein CFN78_08415 [Amycolatopsis antarctica]